MFTSSSATMTKASEATPLVESSSRSVQLYDPNAVLEISRDVANGFLILLSGSSSPSSSKRKKSKKSKKKSESAMSLAFMSITDGNVVDACFGFNINHKKNRGRNDKAVQLARDAKEALREASEASVGVRNLAVSTYENAFRIVVEYHDSIKALNIFTCCFRQGKIRKDSMAALEVEFLQLQEAIVASS